MTPRAEILSKQIICQEPGRYIGWPTIARTRADELIVVFSGDRDGHICPWGKMEMVRSADDGETWTEPVVIRNTPLDDRDAGLLETSAGVLRVRTRRAFLMDGATVPGSSGSPVILKPVSGRVQCKSIQIGLPPPVLLGIVAETMYAPIQVGSPVLPSFAGLGLAFQVETIRETIELFFA